MSKLDPVKVLDPKVKVQEPCTVPPDPSMYAFVVRRRDRVVQAWRVSVPRYSGGRAIARDITTPWDGVRAPTLFLKNLNEVKAAAAAGWRENITAKWRDHLAEGGVPAEAAPIENEGADLESLGYRDLQKLAKGYGLSAGGSKDDLKRRIQDHLAK